MAAPVAKAAALAACLAAGGISDCRRRAVLDVALTGAGRLVASVGRKVGKVPMALGNSVELQLHRQVQL